ncbi:hypothetical protein IW140_004052 [Coemansia sp. RSA 1813]|nr:hypothetical protein EV178_003068 [Coemansia sp. RSA 1646]KAJ2568234.1 hypothetical protein IW140_004052 [Coemansia sp. RSA 1813]
MDLLRKRYTPINETQTNNGKGKKKGTAADAASHTNGSSALTSLDVNEQLVEGSGFRRAAHSLFPGDRLSSGWRSVRPIGPGLSNLGNTCFLNSVLQCLTYTPPLAEYLLTREHSSSCRAGDNCILCRFENHVARALSKRENSTIAPKSIVGRLKMIAKHMRVGRQEDAHEFLRFLIESIQRSLMHGIDPKIDQRIQETTLMHRVFGGYLQSQVHCTHCGYDSNTFEPALDINLDIQAGSHIAKALRSFVRPETLTRDNRYKCEKCGKLVEAIKQTTVYRLPRILTLQLKRFSAFGGKINRYVEFPLTLDMRSYVSKSSLEREPCMYSLYAVLVHSGGTARSGHYFCFVKSPAGVWYELNDSMVHQVSERTVLKQSAYLLFYERSASKTGTKPNVGKKEEERPSLQSKVQSTPVGGLMAKQIASSKSILSASDDMEDLLQSTETAMLSKEARKERKKNKKKNRKEKKLAAENGTLSTETVSFENNVPSTKPESASSAKHSKQKTNSSASVGLDDVVKEFSQIMCQAVPIADKEKEDTVGSKVPESPRAAETEAKVDCHTESNGLSSPWIVRSKPSKAQVIIGWNENTTSKRSKLAAAEGTVNKKADDWNIAEVRGKRASQYGADVESWAGGESIADEVSGVAKARRKRQQHPDMYDTEYDRGRIKKVKKNKHNKFASTINPYQMYSEHTFKKSN